MILRLALILFLGLLLQSCSWIKSWGDDDIEVGDPVPLVEFSPSLQTNKKWSVKIGDGIGRKRTQLRPVIADGSIYAADYKGLLVSVDAATGRKRWELKTELPFSGGPGVQGSSLYVGTENGTVHSFDTSSGATKWVAEVSSEILAAPKEEDGVVVVRSIDGRIFGLDKNTGQRIWIYDHSVPLLTLRGNSEPLVRAGVVYIGYDGGEVVALRLQDGSLMWEQAVISTEGRSELERLADIDGQLVYVASDLLVSSYKTRLASLAADSGRLLWFKEIASATGVVVERINLAISDREDNVWMLDRRNGATSWKQDQLSNRALTRPAFFGSFVVVGDFEGYLHWLNVSDGTFAARTKVGGSGFVAAPLVVGDTLYVLTNGGELSAFGAGS
ncbi:MAG: outer membrane protein assembly factor BamB [Lysobacterales bacterium]|jgi:outer membrane protein assembly factor BamB